MSSTLNTPSQKNWNKVYALCQFNCFNTTVISFDLLYFLSHWDKECQIYEQSIMNFNV